MRLDAVLRKGVAMHSEELPISNVELHHFNKLRNLKVDWDLVLARRWLEMCTAKRMPNDIHREEEEEECVTRPQEPRSTRVLRRMTHSLAFTQSGEDRDNTDWDVAILPRHSSVMAEGVLRFGEDIGWPQQSLDVIRESFIMKLCNTATPDKEEVEEEMLARGVETLDHPHVPQHTMDKSTVELRRATEKTLGGPLSHTWLGGLVVPGYITCDLLICTLLEQDPEALMRLGTIAHPRSGFVLHGRSYWSKTCIIATVLACMGGAKERMGWIGLPESAGPVTEGLQAFGDGWKVVTSDAPPRMRDGERILDGELLSMESSPLGIGHGKVLSQEFGMVTDDILDDLGGMVEVRGLELMLNEKHGDEKVGTAEYTASVGFQVIQGGKGIGEGEKKHVKWPLRYNVMFVGSHPCRLPPGLVGVQSAGLPPATEDGAGAKGNEILGRSTTTESDASLSTVTTTTAAGEPSTPSELTHRTNHHGPRHAKHKCAGHLPAHPLHQSYKYMTRSIGDILDLGPNDCLPTPMDKEAGLVWIIDARGSWEREVLVRSWCAKVGRHALVSRVGKSCLSCAMREAKGLEIGVIIRIGEVR